MQRELPSWVIPATAVLGIVVLGVVIWRSVTATSPAAPKGRDIVVRPGMYDMRAEMQKRRQTQ